MRKVFLALLLLVAIAACLTTRVQADPPPPNAPHGVHVYLMEDSSELTVTAPSSGPTTNISLSGDLYTGSMTWSWGSSLYMGSGVTAQFAYVASEDKWHIVFCAGGHYTEGAELVDI